MKHCGLALLLVAGGAGAVELGSTPESQAGLGLTIYANGSALVREERTVDLVPGEVSLRFTGISDQILPETTQLRSDGIFRTDAIVYRPASLSRETLLRAHLGKEVLLVGNHPQTGEAIQHTATLLSVEGGAPLVRLDDRVEAIEAGAPRRIAFPKVPAALHAQPALLAEGETQARGPQSIELSYLTQGLNWQADYVLTLAPHSQRADLVAWLSLENNTRSDYREADLQLIAGAPALAQDAPPAPMMAERALSKVSDQSLEGYRVYTVEDPVTLLAGERRQLRWLQQEDVPLQRRFVTRGYALAQPQEAESMAVRARLTLSGTEKPLPAGTVRVYSPDAGGRLQFIGADRIDDLPSDEPVQLEIGRAATVTASRSLTDLQRAPHETVVAWRIVLRNDGPEPAQVTLEEIMGGAWEMLAASAPEQSAAGNVARWDLEVPADGERVLEYRARIATR